MSLSVFSDEHFMKLAYLEAQKAFEMDEVPVGAIIVCDNQVIAKAHNMTEALNDVTAHAEMQVFTMAANFLGGKFLDECTLYVTLEPCPMCAGAAYWTRLKKVVIAAHDDKRGYRSINENMLHPKTKVKWGVMEVECSTILKEFFAKKRNGF
jgi:tRNA(adenine34) deaminase